MIINTNYQFLLSSEIFFQLGFFLPFWVIKSLDLDPQSWKFNCTTNSCIVTLTSWNENVREPPVFLLHLRAGKTNCKIHRRFNSFCSLHRLTLLISSICPDSWSPGESSTLSMRSPPSLSTPTITPSSSSSSSSEADERPREAVASNLTSGSDWVASSLSPGPLASRGPGWMGAVAEGAGCATSFLGT